MWREHIYRQRCFVPKTTSCNQCPSGLVKYIELNDFPANAINFFVDRTSNPSNSSGVVQVHYWTGLPPSSPPFPNRIWIADVKPGGGSFLFQPTPNSRWLSLFKFSQNVNSFKAVCFKYITESRTFVPQSF